MATKWTEQDNEAAIAEGWAIFDCKGSSNGPWQVQSFDHPEDWDDAPKPYPFMDDRDVWKHIGEGKTELHRKALAFLKENNPQEYEWIQRHIEKEQQHEYH